MNGLVMLLPKRVTSSVLNMRTKMDVLGMKKLVPLLPEMVTSSVLNTRRRTDALEVQTIRVECFFKGIRSIHEFHE